MDTNTSEIISEEPPWHIRNGLTVFFLVIACVFILLTKIKCSSYISFPLKIMASQNGINLSSGFSIDSIYVKNKVTLNIGDTILRIEAMVDSNIQIRPNQEITIEFTQLGTNKLSRKGVISRTKNGAAESTILIDMKGIHGSEGIELLKKYDNVARGKIAQESKSVIQILFHKMVRKYEM